MKNKKKIIIFEILYHHECLKLPYKIFKSMNYETKLFIGKSVVEKLDKNTFQKKDIKVVRQFFYKNLWGKALDKIRNFKIYNIFNLIFIFLVFILIKIEILINTIRFFIHVRKEKPDYIYINTIDSLFSWTLLVGLLFIRKDKIFYTIHSTNILEKNNSKYKIENLINSLQKIILKKLFEKARAFIILANYLNFKFENKSIIKLTNRMIEKNNEKKFKKTTFCIIGAGKIKFKNFENIFQNFNKYLKLKNINKNFQIIINGKCEKEILDLIEKYKLTKYIKFYEAYVSDKLLINNIKKSHYVIIPTYKNSRYGKYAISGGFGDAIAFNIPLIIPKHYVKNHKFENYVFRYEENNFYKDLKTLINLNNYKIMLEKMKKIREKLLIKNISKKFKEVLK